MEGGNNSSSRLADTQRDQIFFIYDKTALKSEWDNPETAILFFSPSTVDSFVQENTARPIAFCIGETTAKHARRQFKDVRIAKVPTVESVIECVNKAFT